jgi:hypothetical protein
MQLTRKVRFAHVKPIWAMAGDSNHTVGHTRHNLSEDRSCVGIERNIRYVNLSRRRVGAAPALSDCSGINSATAAITNKPIATNDTVAD